MQEEIRVGSKRLIKDINRALVVSEVREHGPVSRTEIARHTGLVLSTITKLCDELVDENLIFEFGEGTSTGGRRPINLLFNNSFGYLIGLKIEDNAIIFSLANLRPTIVDHQRVPFPVGSPFDAVLPILLQGITAMAARVQARSAKESSGTRPGKAGGRAAPQLLGIGVAVSGLVDPDSGTLRYSSLLGWENIEFAKLIGEHFDVDVRVDNDVNCYALAQNWLGKGKGARNFVCVTIGEGIGCGIIVDNRLYRGAVGGAGELGHVIVHGDGRACYCGQKGCLEAYASAHAIMEAFSARSGSSNTMDEISSLARAGNKDAVDVFAEAGRAVGWGLVNVVMQHNPEKIILGGEGLSEGEFMLPSIIEELDRNWFNRRKVFRTVIETDELGNENFLLGASILVLSELLGQPIYNEKRTLVTGT